MVDPPTADDHADRRATAPSGRSGLRSSASRFRQSLAVNGLDLGRMAASAKGLSPFLADRRRFRRQHRTTDGPFRSVKLLPVLADRTEEAGGADDQYFQQDLHVARLVREADPVRHVDVGSRIDGFVAHLLVFRSVEVVDVRPLTSTVEGLSFVQADGSTLEPFADGSLPSLSSLHAVEHFGLGRYGDPVEADAPLRAFRTFERVLAPGGRLYLAVPVGRRRVEFNAHRVFDPSDPVDLLPGLELRSFDGIDDAGTFHTGVEPASLAGEQYGLGIYVFDKPGSPTA
jgi:SAM-dependent methyltransferase